MEGLNLIVDCQLSCPVISRMSSAVMTLPLTYGVLWDTYGFNWEGEGEDRRYREREGDYSLICIMSGNMQVGPPPEIPPEMEQRYLVSSPASQYTPLHRHKEYSPVTDTVQLAHSSSTQQNTLYLSV